jgi:hypothetical protein
LNGILKVTPPNPPNTHTKKEKEKENMSEKEKQGSIWLLEVFLKL